MTQLSIPLDNHIHELLVQLKSQHEDLLHQQLAQIRRAYIQQFGHQAVNVTTDKTADSSIPGNIVFVQSPGGSNIRLLEEGSSGELADDSRIVVMKTEEMENRSGDDEEEQVDAMDNSNSELVISTESGELVKGDVTKMDDYTQGKAIVNVPEAAVFESMDNETVVQVTLSGSAQQEETCSTEHKAVEQKTEKAEDKEPEESSPRSKRRKKSH